MNANDLAQLNRDVTLSQMNGNAVTAADFSDSMLDTQRDMWTVPKVEALIAAGEGQQFILIINGLMYAGAEILEVRPSYSAQYDVLIRTAHDRVHGLPGGLYPLANLQVVIALNRGVKYDAIRSYDALKSQAIRQAVEERGSAGWGQWSAHPVGGRRVNVRYIPNFANPHYAEQAGEPFDEEVIVR